MITPLFYIIYYILFYINKVLQKQKRLKSRSSQGEKTLAIFFNDETKTKTFN